MDITDDRKGLRTRRVAIFSRLGGSNDISIQRQKWKLHPTTAAIAAEIAKIGRVDMVKVNRSWNETNLHMCSAEVEY
jgi:hypothetical protein